MLRNCTLIPEIADEAFEYTANLLGKIFSSYVHYKQNEIFIYCVHIMK